MKTTIKLLTGTISLVALLFTANSFANDQPNNRPYLDNNVVTIPTIDFKGELSVFQDVTFKHLRSGTWRLVGFQRGQQIQQIAEAQLIQTKTFPVQVFLKISGIFNNSCQKIGHISQNHSDKSMDIAVFYDNEATDPDRFCLMVMVPFTKTIPLPVYGLSLGTYNYSVNGNFTGSFTLTKDNFFLEKPSGSIF